MLVDAGVIDVDAAKQVREDARQLAIAARRKALADPMPDRSTSRTVSMPTESSDGRCTYLEAIGLATDGRDGAPIPTSS